MQHRSGNRMSQKRHCQIRDNYRTPAIDDFVFVHKEPVAINYMEVSNAIGYPSVAKEAGIEGSVIVRVLVDEHGNYLKHKVISQAHPLLGRSCDSYVNNLYFTPAVRDGQPVKFWVNIPFHFHN
ncbi:MAG: energy transducer TonB [Bacteroidia bacterium]